jgi:hypothetical protein
MNHLTQKMHVLLNAIDLPKREIKCYGRQITIECESQASCQEWEKIVSKFTRTRGIIKSMVETQKSLQKNISTKKYMDVYRLYAVID